MRAREGKALPPSKKPKPEDLAPVPYVSSEFSKALVRFSEETKFDSGLVEAAFKGNEQELVKHFHKNNRMNELETGMKVYSIMSLMLVGYGGYTSTIDSTVPVWLAGVPLAMSLFGVCLAKEVKKDLKNTIESKITDHVRSFTSEGKKVLTHG